MFCVWSLFTATCDIVSPTKDTSFWLSLELVRTADFCCVWGWCSLKHEKATRGQVGTLRVRLVQAVCQLILLSIGDLLVNFLPVWFLSPFSEAKYSVLARRGQLIVIHTLTHCYDVSAMQKRGRSTRIAVKGFRIPFRILAIYCTKVQKTDVKSTSPTLSLKRGYIQQI